MYATSCLSDVASYLQTLDAPGSLSMTLKEALTAGEPHVELLRTELI